MFHLCLLNNWTLLRIRFWHAVNFHYLNTFAVFLIQTERVGADYCVDLLFRSLRLSKRNELQIWECSKKCTGSEWALIKNANTFGLQCRQTWNKTLGSWSDSTLKLWHITIIKIQQLVNSSVIKKPYYNRCCFEKKSWTLTLQGWPNDSPPTPPFPQFRKMHFSEVFSLLGLGREGERKKERRQPDQNSVCLSLICIQ